MYKSLARIWLEITGIRLEQVQNIKRSDVLAEGIDQIHIDKFLKHNFHPDDAHGLAFRELWDSINKDRGYGWDEILLDRLWLVNVHAFGFRFVCLVGRSCQECH